MRLLPLMLLVVCCSARAAWIPIACANKCSDAAWEYDPKRVTRSGNVIEVWIKSSGTLIKESYFQGYVENPGLFPATEASDFQSNYSYSLTRYVIKCKEYQFGSITAQHYRNNGAPIGASSAPTPLNYEIIPDSLMDTTASKLCKKK